tara:strand:+ start:2276 stop:2578 length:303 start_codon:yes stop_codon:yes gene_type:complete
MARHSRTIAGLTSEIAAQLKFAKDPNILVFTPLGGLGPVDIVTLNIETGEYKAYDVKSKNLRKTNNTPSDGYERNTIGSLIARPRSDIQKKLNVKIIYVD